MVAPTTNFGSPGRQRAFLGQLNHMLGQTNMPQTISTSHTGNKQTRSPDNAKSVCAPFSRGSARAMSAYPSQVVTQVLAVRSARENDGHLPCPIPTHPPFNFSVSRQSRRNEGPCPKVA